MNKKLAIWGWWQGGNLGDNWIKKVLSDIFPEACFINTNEKEFSDYDFVICGGGGLYIYDTIRPWTEYSQNTPFGMLGLGAEFPHKSNNALELKEKSCFFYIRDQYSLDCMKIKDIPRSYDLTFYDPLSKVELLIFFRNRSVLQCVIYCIIFNAIIFRKIIFSCCKCNGFILFSIIWIISK